MVGSRPGSSHSSNGGASSSKPVYKTGPKSGKKLLTAKDMEIGKYTCNLNAAFQLLDKALGGNEYAAAVAPIRMVTLGGSMAVKMFKNRTATVDVDVIIDPNVDAVDEFRQAVLDCIDAVAKKKDLETDWMNDSCKMFFQKGAVREKVFLESVGFGEKMYSGANLEIYAIDLKIALERKLRRLLDPSRSTEVDLADALCFLKHMTSYGQKPLGLHQCQALDYNGHKLPVPIEATRMLQRSFEENRDNDARIKGKQGIVDMVFDKATKRWFYRNKQGQQVWVTWNV